MIFRMVMSRDEQLHGLEGLLGLVIDKCVYVYELDRELVKDTLASVADSHLSEESRTSMLVMEYVYHVDADHVEEAQRML